MRYPEEVQGYIDNLNDDYEVNEELEQFTILHLYPGKAAYPHGYHDSRFFQLVGFNEETMQKRDLGEHDGLDFGRRVQSRSPQLYLIRVFVDGSTLIRFNEPVKVLDYQSADVIPARN